jgi:hypothetical protein
MIALPEKSGYGCRAFGELPSAGEQSQNQKESIMGDRSPKSVHKQATQKQTKTNSVAKKKQESVAAKQLGSKNR